MTPTPTPTPTPPSASPRVAVVVDWLNQSGGAERVIREILAAYPDAELFAQFDVMRPADRARITDRPARTSFLQHVPGIAHRYRSLLPLIRGKRVAGWRKSVFVEYWAENAYPWLVGMTYKAVRTDRYKYIHWVNRARNGELDELYDLERDPYELINVAKKPGYRSVRTKLVKELRKLTADALGL